MDYLCRTYLNLRGNLKKPGDLVTTEELTNAHQTDEDIASFVEYGTLSTNLNDDLHDDHKPLPPPRIMSGHPIEDDRTHVIDTDNLGVHSDEA